MLQARNEAKNALYLISRLMKLQRQKKWNAALVVVNKLMMLKPKSELIYMISKIDILQSLGRNDEALNLCEQALQEYPEEKDLKQKKLQLLLHLNRISEVFEFFTFTIAWEDNETQPLVQHLLNLCTGIKSEPIQKELIQE